MEKVQKKIFFTDYNAPSSETFTLHSEKLIIFQMDTYNIHMRGFLNQIKVFLS
jgi:hypothetical protein